MRWFTLMWVCMGCQPDAPDPDETLDAQGFLIGLAKAHVALVDDLKVDIGYSRSALTSSLEDGESTTIWDGTFSWDGMEVTGDGVFEREDGTFQNLTWTMAVTYVGLGLGQQVVTGSASLVIDESLFESHAESHDHGGILGFADDDHDVAYTAHLAGSTVNTLDGSVDDAQVDFDNPNPDYP